MAMIGTVMEPRKRRTAPAALAGAAQRQVLCIVQSTSAGGILKNGRYEIHEQHAGSVF